MTPLSSRGEVNNYCHFVQSETYEACPEKDFYTYIYYYFKSWIALNKKKPCWHWNYPLKLYVRTKILKRLFEIYVGNKNFAKYKIIQLFFKYFIYFTSKNYFNVLLLLQFANEVIIYTLRNNSRVNLIRNSHRLYLSMIQCFL